MDPVQPAGGAPPAPGADPPKPGEAAPSYVTEEQLQTALTARFRTFEQKVDKALSDGLGAFGGKLKDELAALLPKPEPKAGGRRPRGRQAQGRTRAPSFAGSRSRSAS